MTAASPTMNAPFRSVVARAALALGLAPAFITSASAQAVIAPLSASPAPASRSAAAATGKPRNLASITSALRDGLPIFRRGPVVFHTHLRYRFIQADGLHATPGFPVDTTIQEVSPSLIFDIGEHWHLNYTPAWTFYSSRFFTDTFNQNANVSGGTTYGPLHLGASHTYSTDNSVLIETGGQTHQETHATTGSARYQFGRRTTLQTEISRSDRQIDPIDDDPQWTSSDWLQYSGSAWLLYQYSAKFTAGVGFEIGYDYVSAGPDMVHTSPQAQVTWRPTEKWSLHARGGAEQRNVKDGNDTSLNNPIYSGALEYQAFTTTKLTLGASRSVSASHFANRASRTTGWTVGLQQRLLRRFYFTSEFAERRTSYLAVGLGDLPGGIPPERDDKGRSFTARLSTPFLQRGSISIFYQNSRNETDLSGYDFRSSQYGLELDYHF